MRIKKGVKLTGLRPEILLALFIAEQVYNIVADIELELTEATGGKHGYGSLHYVGLAIDIGIKNLNKSQINTIVAELKKRLGENYDVVLESTHIHIEYQPK